MFSTFSFLEDTEVFLFFFGAEKSEKQKTEKGAKNKPKSNRTRGDERIGANKGKKGGHLKGGGEETQHSQERLLKKKRTQNPVSSIVPLPKPLPLPLPLAPAPPPPLPASEGSSMY